MPPIFRDFSQLGKVIGAYKLLLEAVYLFLLEMPGLGSLSTVFVRFPLYFAKSN
jgi:hypothetical protein